MKVRIAKDQGAPGLVTHVEMGVGGGDGILSSSVGKGGGGS